MERGTRKRGISERVYKKITTSDFRIVRPTFEKGSKLSQDSEIEREITGITIAESKGKIENNESKGQLWEPEKKVPVRKKEAKRKRFSKSVSR